MRNSSDFVGIAEAALRRGKIPETFPERGPRDSKGRSLRDFDLHTRLFRYPLSYMIYTKVFDAMPDVVRERVYRRLYEILTDRTKAKPSRRFRRPTAGRCWRSCGRRRRICRNIGWNDSRALFGRTDVARAQAPIASTWLPPSRPWRSLQKRAGAAAAENCVKLLVHVLVRRFRCRVQGFSEASSRTTVPIQSNS